MNKYFMEKEVKDCCGCRACEQICPVKCINIKKNEEGFLYPDINLEKCVQCGMCSKVCPMENEYKNEEEQIAYAAISSDDTTLLKSSSGGIFFLLAKWIIKQKGYVFGAYLNKDFILQQKGASNIDEIKQLLGSKYIQSDTNNTFSVVRKMVEQGKLVLYVSTPCQIAAIKLFLGKEYSNFYTIDLLCHGVPSNDLYLGYINYLEKKHHGKVVSFSFRDKEKFGWSITLKYVIEKSGKRKAYYVPAGLSPYFYAFLRGKVLRESCYRCPYTTIQRAGDITLADFWGIEKVIPKLESKKGCSCVICNTKKGKDWFENIIPEANIKEVTINQATVQNINFFESTKRPEERNSIYKEYSELGFKYVSKKYFKNPKGMRIRIKSILKQIKR